MRKLPSIKEEEPARYKGRDDTKLKHPSQYWVEHKTQRGGAWTLQERKAFHVGIEAAFDFFIRLDTKNATSKQVAEDLRWFHRHNKATLSKL
jgi:hypothetical protein